MIIELTLISYIIFISVNRTQVKLKRRIQTIINIYLLFINNLSTHISSLNRYFLIILITILVKKEWIFFIFISDFFIFQQIDMFALYERTTSLFVGGCDFSDNVVDASLASSFIFKPLTKENEEVRERERERMSSLARQRSYKYHHQKCSSCSSSGRHKMW